MPAPDRLLCLLALLPACDPSYPAAGTILKLAKIMDVDALDRYPSASLKKSFVSSSRLKRGNQAIPPPFIVFRISLAGRGVSIPASVSACQSV